MYHKSSGIANAINYEIRKAPKGGTVNDQDTAREIRSMLKGALMALPNDRTDKPETGYEYNRMAPGVLFAMEVIGKAFNLEDSK